MQHLDSILVFLETTSKKEPLCFERAITIAVMTGAKLVIAGIVPFWDEFFRLTSDKNAQRQTQETIQASIKDYLEPFKIRAKKAGVSTKIRLLEGPIALALLDEMIEHKHALLIKDETKEGEVRELFFGAIDQKLVRQSPAPVWIVRTSSYEAAHVIVAATDAELDTSDDLSLNTELMAFASTLSRPGEFLLHILHAWEFGYDMLVRSHVSAEQYAEWYQLRKNTARTKFKSFLTHFQKEYDSPSVHFLMGKPSSVIAHHCNTNKADTLVIGTVGRAGLDGFLIGNTAERVLHQVSCSILAVKPQRIPSPITKKRLKR